MYRTSGRSCVALCERFRRGRVPWLPRPGPVRHGALGDGEHRRDAVGVADVEEHPLGELPADRLRREVEDEERLLPFNLAGVGALRPEPREDLPAMVTEIDGEPH